MHFCNKTSRSVFLKIHSEEYCLQPQESKEIECPERFHLSLRHSYGSTALSKREIAADFMDDSVVSLLISSYKKPYFELVLDCVYEVTVSNASTIDIHRTTIRPVYSCSYDRLHPVSQGCQIRMDSCDFSERKHYEKCCLDAVCSGNKTILTVLLIVLGVAELPLILLCALAKTWLGVVYIAVMLLVLAVVYWVGNGITKAFRKAEWQSVVNHFESQRIIQYFQSSTTNDVVSEE